MNVFSLGAHGYRISLHIGSGGVSGVCLKDETETGRPTIVYAHRSDVPIREHVQAQTLELHTSEAIERVLKNIHDHIKSRVDHVDVVFASPWFSARTKTVAVERTDAFVVTKRMIDDIVKKEVATLGHPDADNEPRSSDNVVLEQKITRIRLNGYESNSPFSKKVRQCEVSLFASFVSKNFREKITHTIEKIISPHSIVFRSFPFVSFSALSNMWHDDRYFAYIDVGAEVTEVVCCEHGALSESFSFPLGTNHLVRAIAQKREIPLELALSLLSVYARGASDAETAASIEAIIAPLREEWLVYINQVIQESGNNHHVVQKMYLSADDASLSLWSSVLSAHSHNMVILTPDTLQQFVTTPASTHVDAINLLESIFVDTANVLPHLQSSQN